MIEERTGLLVARGEGVYAFSHLTFQEYLAAVAIAAQDDYVAYTLAHTAEAWWREVILLEAGHLSMRSKERTARLIRAIAEQTREPQPYHNLVLASDCLRDVGSGRVQGNVEQEVQQRLRKELEIPPRPQARWLGRMAGKSWVERRSEAMQAIVRAGGGYWTQPFGEPEWVHVPAGEFWMGSEKGFERERPLHRLSLGEFWIARIPVTNAQYALIVQQSDHRAPDGWEEKTPLKGRESHPVVNVSWDDAMACCAWLSRMSGRTITLPTEAQWEKAARGDQDQREYPWGDAFDAMKCNSEELGHGDTTPAGIFPEGVSPYGCLDMAGNVREWTRSKLAGYPYDPADGRERIEIARSAGRVVRGGSFSGNVRLVRCAARHWYLPLNRNGFVGFRVVLSPSPLGDGASGR